MNVAGTAPPSLVATVKTKITEVVTALGIMGIHARVEAAMHTALPPAVGNLRPADWAEILSAHDAGEHQAEFEAAFANGRHFLDVELAGAAPRSIEWRGNRKTLYHHDIPVDIRVNRVYLISCKYNSKVLLNPSPQALFAGALAVTGRGPHWYEEVASEEHAAFYRDCVACAGLDGFPPNPMDMAKPQRDVLRKAFPRKLPPELEESYRRLAQAVAAESARRWEEAVPGRERDLLLKMLRISSVDYFLLGVQRSRAQRLKLLNSADWHRKFSVTRFGAWPAEGSLQPQVQWRADIETKAAPKKPLAVEGHVEVRWSHGKFCGNPEAKVYLDTPIERVPGYEEL